MAGVVTTGADELFLGIDWSTGTPRARIGRLDRGPTQLVPLDRPLRFWADGDQRYCCGRFDLTAATAGHVPCPASLTVTTGVQCPSCRYQEGFTTAHQAHRGGAMADNVRDHLARPHRLYIAAFAGGALKVGTVAESRLGSRLPEQGALAARYVARAGDGMAVRRAEDAVARGLGLATGVRRGRKLAGLVHPVDLATLEARVEEVAGRVPAVLDGIDVDAIDLTSSHAAWRPPAPTTAVLRRPRRVRSPRPLSSGAHALVPVGMVGSIVASATGPDDSSCVLADLGDLRGHAIRRGDVAAPADEPIQFPLF